MDRLCHSNHSGSEARKILYCWKFAQKLVDSGLVVGCHRQKDYLRVPESKILQLIFVEKKSGLVGSGFVIRSHEQYKKLQNFWTDFAIPTIVALKQGRFYTVENLHQS